MVIESSVSGDCERLNKDDVRKQGQIQALHYEMDKKEFSQLMHGRTDLSLSPFWMRLVLSLLGTKPPAQAVQGMKHHEAGLDSKFETYALQSCFRGARYGSGCPCSM